jgi:hypothetical protein
MIDRMYNIYYEIEVRQSLQMVSCKLAGYVLVK